MLRQIRMEIKLLQSRTQIKCLSRLPIDFTIHCFNDFSQIIILYRVKKIVLLQSVYYDNLFLTKNNIVITKRTSNGLHVACISFSIPMTIVNASLHIRVLDSRTGHLAGFCPEI